MLPMPPRYTGLWCYALLKKMLWHQSKDYLLLYKTAVPTSVESEVMHASGGIDTRWMA